jgi:predicted nucleic acid-binding protein
MSVDSFIDSNIWLYAFVANPGEEMKHDHARALVETVSPCVISSQVVVEVCNNLLRKAGMTEAELMPVVEDLYRRYDVRDTGLDCHRTASRLRSAHAFSYWDSLIVASALDAGCHTLYTEDMQHGQMIDAHLRITNPFLEVTP